MEHRIQKWFSTMTQVFLHLLWSVIHQWKRNEPSRAPVLCGLARKELVSTAMTLTPMWIWGCLSKPVGTVIWHPEGVSALCSAPGYRYNTSWVHYDSGWWLFQLWIHANWPIMQGTGHWRCWRHSSFICLHSHENEAMFEWLCCDDCIGLTSNEQGC